MYPLSLARRIRDGESEPSSPRSPVGGTARSSPPPGEAAPPTPAHNRREVSNYQNASLMAATQADLQALLAMQRQQKKDWEQMLERHSQRAFEKRRLEGLRHALRTIQLFSARILAQQTGDIGTPL